MKEFFVPRRFRKTSLVAIDRANAILDEYRAKGFETMTLRQIYYQFVVRGFLPPPDPNLKPGKANLPYKCLLSILNDARLAGLMDWDSIQDDSRTLRTRPSWDDLPDFIADVFPQHHLNRWKGQRCVVEVWVEKEAAVGVLRKTCHQLDTPLFPTKGNDSQGLMYEAAKRLKASLDDGKTVTVLYLGDHDPTGVDCSRDIRERLDLFGCAAVNLKRLALNIDQVKAFNLPSQAVKVGDKRTKGYQNCFGDRCWELDALDPVEMVRLVKAEILSRIDTDAWERVEEQEEEDDSALENFQPFLEALRSRPSGVVKRCPVV